MPQQSEDFADVIERSQRVTPADVSNPFAGRDSLQPGRAKNGPDLDYDAHIKVFALPADAGDYEDVMNVILRGEGVLRYEERAFSKDGDFLVAICWVTPRTRIAQAPADVPNGIEPEVRPRRIP